MRATCYISRYFTGHIHRLGLHIFVHSIVKEKK
jgi:hypothetical protein